MSKSWSARIVFWPETGYPAEYPFHLLYYALISMTHSYYFVVNCRESGEPSEGEEDTGGEGQEEPLPGQGGHDQRGHRGKGIHFKSVNIKVLL